LWLEPHVGTIFDVLGNVIEAHASDYGSIGTAKIAEAGTYKTIVDAIARRDAKIGTTYVVYELFDDTGKVRYVGRTRQDIYTRQSQHWNTIETLPDGTKTKPKYGLNIRVATHNGKELQGLLHSEARGLEHLVYQKWIDAGVVLLNKIRALNLENPKIAIKVATYLERAALFLNKVI
jgi:hypothetical protein